MVKSRVLESAPQESGTPPDNSRLCRGLFYQSGRRLAVASSDHCRSSAESDATKKSAAPGDALLRALHEMKALARFY
jgi:hypothetical protein